jgi:hypothetical protein
MHGDNGFRLEQIAGVGGLARPHGEVIADRQHDDLRSVELSDDGHVSENVRVSGVVDLDAVFELDHITAGFAALDNLIAILDATGMVGVHHGDSNVANLLRATLIHRGDFLGAFFLQPSAQFRNADDLWIMLFDHFDSVSNVIEVAVSAEKNINILHLLLRSRAHRIIHNPGIDNYDPAARSYDAKSRMAEPSKLNAFEIHK